MTNSVDVTHYFVSDIIDSSYSIDTLGVWEVSYLYMTYEKAICSLSYKNELQNFNYKISNLVIRMKMEMLLIFYQCNKGIHIHDYKAP